MTFQAYNIFSMPIAVNINPELISSTNSTPKATEKLTQPSISKYQNVSPQLNPRNLKLIANQSQSKPAIVRRNSPSQKG
jgi:hypothetical protein